MTYLEQGDQALVPNPGYPTYSSAVKLAGGECISYELTEPNNWQPDFEKLQQLVEKSNRIKLMFVNYPHMPTGQLPDRSLFEKIIAFAKKNNILVCHDNPYSFILNDRPMRRLSVNGAKEVAVELNSLSKSHNMAGWRIGVLCGAKEFIDDVLRFKSNMDSGMFLPLQLAAAKALQAGKEWHDELNNIYAKRKALVIELMTAIGCQPAPDQAGLFVWAKVPGEYKDGYALSDELLYQSNVFITPGGIFGSAGEKFIRISLCTTEEKLKLAISRVQKIKA
jgi:aspartate/methionine/tyrosine aminotransferase